MSNATAIRAWHAAFRVLNGLALMVIGSSLAPWRDVVVCFVGGALIGDGLADAYTAIRCGLGRDIAEEPTL